MFEDVKVGDVVKRRLSQRIIMELKVTEIDGNTIYCGDRDVGWAFRRDTGGEVDPEQGWDGVNRTRSRLVKEFLVKEEGNDD